MDNDTIVTVRVRTIRDIPGKAIYITFKDKTYQLLTDVRCVGNTAEDAFCKNCKLKFRCFTSDALRINVENDLGDIAYPEEPTINQMVKDFLARNGVDLTKLEARAKIVEDEEAKKIEEEPSEEQVRQMIKESGILDEAES